MRRTPPTDPRVHVAHRAALDLMQYQLFPAYKALDALRPRLLIADGTGLGKTVEVGILLAELIKRGRARRILVVAIKSMLAQLQRELWARFTIPLVRLDSEGLRRVEQKIPSNRNPFSYYDRCIISVDTLKNNPRYRAWLEHIRWDVIVVDECHNVANRGSQREQLARLLAAQCDALILTSATPHNGRPESFANLMRMLDPTAVADERHFAREDVQHLFVRRFKKDVEAQAGTALRDRRVHVHEARASREEEAALAALHALELRNLGRKRHAVDRLLRWALVKAFLSSPHAALESLDERMKNTERALDRTDLGPHPYEVLLQTDLGRLRAARAKVAAATAPRAFSKLRRLVDELRAIGFTGRPDSPRVVIFSERIATLDLLRDVIAREFAIASPGEVIGRFDASDLTDIQQRQVVESFGRESSPMRVLLASDAASEGVNLHYHCAQLFHFDIPWSLIRLTQRNGRIDRFGQKHEPQLHYLMTRTEAATADQHVAARLIEKEDSANQQLGDVGTLLGLYDPDAEDAYITEGIAKGQSAEELLPDEPLRAGEAEAWLEASAEAESSEEDAEAEAPAAAQAAPPDDVDLVAMLDAIANGEEPMLPATAPAAVATVQPGTTAEPEVGIDLLALLDQAEAAEARTPPLEQLIVSESTLYPDDYTFVVAALRHLEKHPVIGDAGLKWEADDAHRTLKISAPRPFCTHREPFLPAEAVREDAPYQLVQSREEVAKRLRRALEGDGSWPEWHLLWEQHPLVDWLLDALAASYARHEAPVLRIPSMPRDSALFLLNAQQYNHESEPIFASWFAVETRGKRLADEAIPFRELAARVGLFGDLVNPGAASARLDALRALVPAVIARAKEVAIEQREASLKRVRARVRAETRRIVAWEAKALATVAAKRRRIKGPDGQMPLPLDAQEPKRLPPLLEKRLQQEEADIRRARENHEQFLKQLQAAGPPYIRLVTVFSAE
ncbi:SNF2-related protein [Sorangium sp. So ce1335]|uniref:SNF2-related protein n=1 Tax=Sorangium sp. So ce1335 TaxID=3133335 RepID=UPI003F618ED1